MRKPSDITWKDQETKLLEEIQAVLGPTTKQFASHPELGPWIFKKIHGIGNPPCPTENWKLQNTERQISDEKLAAQLQIGQMVEQNCNFDQVIIDLKNRQITTTNNFTEEFLKEKKIAVAHRENTKQIFKTAKRLYEKQEELQLPSNHNLAYKIQQAANRDTAQIPEADWKNLPPKAQEELSLIYATNPLEPGYLDVRSICRCFAIDSLRYADEIKEKWASGTRIQTPTGKTPIGLAIMQIAKEPIAGRPTLTKEQLTLKDNLGWTGWNTAAACGRLQEAVNSWPDKKEALAIIRQTYTDCTGVNFDSPLETSALAGRGQELKSLMSWEEILKNQRILENLITSGAIANWQDELTDKVLMQESTELGHTLAQELLELGLGKQIPAKCHTPELLQIPIKKKGISQPTWLARELLIEKQIDPTNANWQALLEPNNGQHPLGQLPIPWPENITWIIENVPAEYVPPKIAKEIVQNCLDKTLGCLWLQTSIKATQSKNRII